MKFDKQEHLIQNLDSVNAAQVPRFQAMLEQFKKLHSGLAPAFFARAPGRVNLIGEHVDYSGYNVLPMAIDRDFVLAVAVEANTSASSFHLTIHNTNPKFTSLDTDIALPVPPVEQDKLQWYHYFLAGVKGVIEKYSLKKPVHLKILVDGRVPPAAGLSSSSAFCVAATLCTVIANNVQSIPRMEIGHLAAQAERYVGTASGGMDQAISVLAQEGVAKMIAFNPLSSSDVYLPSTGAFIVAHCMRESPKAETAVQHYNKRVVECRLAAVLMAKAHGLSNYRDMKTLKQTQLACKLSFVEAEALAVKSLQAGSYSKAQLTNALGKGIVEVLVADIPLSTKVLAANNSFFLQDRARHVYSEAARVFQFQEACAGNGDKAKGGKRKRGEESELQVLGDLMNASHFSCDTLFDCSCEELNILTRICRRATNDQQKEASGKKGKKEEKGTAGGLAYGARLTGAGWGGCVVALVAVADVPAFLKLLREEYYNKIVKADEGKGGKFLKLPEDEESYLFATLPSAGAYVLTDVAGLKETKKKKSKK